MDRQILSLVISGISTLRLVSVAGFIPTNGEMLSRRLRESQPKGQLEVDPKVGEYLNRCGHFTLASSDRSDGAHFCQSEIFEGEPRDP